MNEIELIRRRTVGYWWSVLSLLDGIKPLKDLETECPDIQGVRESVKKSLRVIHENTKEFLSENNCYYVVFALASHCDEVARAHVDNFPSESWRPLQDELFGTGDAGNLFYKYIELFRGRNDISQITFQTFYFCLNDGFKGRHIFDPETKSGFMTELLSYIHIKAIPQEAFIEHNKPRKAVWKLPAWTYYASIPVFLYLILSLMSLVPISAPAY